MRTIVHLDADAFFAAVEQASDPKLRGKPIAVGGEKRGIIASASYEARKFGVYTPSNSVRLMLWIVISISSARLSVADWSRTASRCRWHPGEMEEAKSGREEKTVRLRRPEGVDFCRSVNFKHRCPPRNNPIMGAQNCARDHASFSLRAPAKTRWPRSTPRVKSERLSANYRRRNPRADRRSLATTYRRRDEL